MFILFNQLFHPELVPFDLTRPICILAHTILAYADGMVICEMARYVMSTTLGRNLANVMISECLQYEDV